jgi:hypothetical protein
MSGKITISLAACLLAGLAHAQGDRLDMSGTDNSARFEAPGKPTRGMTQERVQSRYGEPRSKDAAVGDPPISRWHYDGFVVYFEYDRVIHSVST